MSDRLIITIKTWILGKEKGLSRVDHFQFDEIDNSKVEKWPALTLLGNDNRLNFTFQLGPPGGKKGYAVSGLDKRSKINYCFLGPDSVSPLQVRVVRERLSG